MEFWGVEVKAGKPFKVQPEYGTLIHISQVALGEVKDVKGAKNVPLRLKFGDENFVIGTLSAEDRAQLMFDLVLDKEFELSHDWKHGSVYFMGYTAENSISDDEGEVFSDPSDSSDDELLKNIEHGLVKPKGGDGKTANGAAAATNALKVAGTSSTKKEESSDSDDDEESEDDSDDDMDLAGAQVDSSDEVHGDDSEEDDSSEEELPKPKVQELPNPKQLKKRPAGPAQETPVAAKKAKSITPEKTGNMKGRSSGKSAAGSSPAGRTPPGDKSKQSPKSGGQFSGKSGNKSFNSKNGKGRRGGK